MQIRTSPQSTNYRRFVFFVVGFLGVLVLAVLARQLLNLSLPESRGVIFQEHYILTDTADAPLAVIADQSQLAEGSIVQGDVALVSRVESAASGIVNGDLTQIGSDVIMRGTVTGDLTLFGTRLVLGGQVDGDVIALGSDITITADARIAGEIVNCAGTLTDNRPEPVGIRSCGQMSALAGIISAGGDLLLPALQPGIGTVLAALTLTGITLLGVMLFPRSMRAMQATVFARPIYTGVTGGMTMLLWIGLAAGAVLLLGFFPPIGLVLIPVLLVAMLTLVVLMAAGWMALAAGLGDSLLRRMFRQAQPPLLAALFGSLLLFALWHVLLILPFGGPVLLLVLAVLSLIGLGAALLAWRGR